MLNKHCSHCAQNCFFCTFWRLKTLALWRKIVQNLLIIAYLFCLKNSTIDSRKTSITQEWLVAEICPIYRWIAFLMLYWLVHNIRSHFNELLEWGIIDKIKRLHRIYTLWTFIFTYSDTTLKLNVWYLRFVILYPIASVPQLSTNKLEDVTILVQIYEFHGKLKKLRKTELWITTEKKKLRLCRKIYWETIIMHTAKTHSEPGQTSKEDPFAKMVKYCSKKLNLRSWLYEGFQPRLKFQLAKLWW